jgi:predicted PurR-regulated permease PerM
VKGKNVAMDEAGEDPVRGSEDSRQWFWLVVGLIFLWLLWKLAPVITPFAISAALAYLFDPLADRLERVKIGKWHWNRVFAVVLVFALMVGLLVLLLLVIVPLLRNQVQDLVARAPEFLDWLGGTAWPWVQQTLGLQSVTLDATSITESIKSYWKEASAALLTVMGRISQSGHAVLTFLINLVLIPVVTFYLLRDWDELLAGVRKLIPRRYEPVVCQLAEEIDDVLGAFIRGQLIVMLALGLI